LFRYLELLRQNAHINDFCESFKRVQIVILIPAIFTKSVHGAFRSFGQFTHSWMEFCSFFQKKTTGYGITQRKKDKNLVQSNETLP